jgi:LmbE family N-acetylglucosaminyl deacetylase
MKNGFTAGSSKNVAVIVAHPDDETLWAGGTIMRHPAWHWFIVCLCRKNDADRAPRFYKALNILNSEGIMGDLDDGPEQQPLEPGTVENVILNLLPPEHFNLIITHSPYGEYTRHLRHEEIGKAVIMLWDSGKISANELWTFAYEDGHKKYFPRPVMMASIYRILPMPLHQKKYRLITETYGFEKSSWEAQTTPGEESFWRFTEPGLAEKWLEQGGDFE